MRTLREEHVRGVTHYCVYDENYSLVIRTTHKSIALYYYMLTS
jgi:hypothetical protein